MPDGRLIRTTHNAFGARTESSIPLPVARIECTAARFSSCLTLWPSCRHLTRKEESMWALQDVLPSSSLVPRTQQADWRGSDAISSLEIRAKNENTGNLRDGKQKTCLGCFLRKPLSCFCKKYPVVSIVQDGVYALCCNLRQEEEEKATILEAGYEHLSLARGVFRINTMWFLRTEYREELEWSSRCQQLPIRVDVAFPAKNTPRLLLSTA